MTTDVTISQTILTADITQAAGPVVAVSVPAPLQIVVSLVGIQGSPGGAAAPSALTPAELGADLALWLDAEDAASITLNGSTVSQWDDKSGNDRHVTQPTAASQPTYTLNGLNGKPVLTFDGGDWFSNLSLSLSQFSVSLVETATQNTALIYYPVGFGTGGISVGGTNFTQKFAIIGTNSLVSTENSVLNAPTIVFGGSNNLGRQIAVNGNAPATNATAQSISQITIGQRSDGFWPFFGTIAEVVLTNNLLSTTDRQLLEGYLAWKWGLEANLPVGHPFRNSPPTV